MSFGTAEAGFTAQVDAVFTAPGMSYLAATGDWGTGVMWPSVSPSVLAVGGTTLSWSGVGARSEIKGALDTFDFVRRQVIETVEEDAVCIGLVIGGEL